MPLARPRWRGNGGAAGPADLSRPSTRWTMTCAHCQRMLHARRLVLQLTHAGDAVVDALRITISSQGNRPRGTFFAQALRRTGPVSPVLRRSRVCCRTPLYPMGLPHPVPRCSTTPRCWGRGEQRRRAAHHWCPRRKVHRTCLFARGDERRNCTLPALSRAQSGPENGWREAGSRTCRPARCSRP